MKVDSATARPNGYLDGATGCVEATPVRHCDNNARVCDLEGTTSNGWVSGDNLSTCSPLSVSEINSDDDDVSMATQTASDDDSSDLDDIVTTGTDVCHAATLEAFLESVTGIREKLESILLQILSLFLQK